MGDLRASIRAALEASSLIAAVLYGYGWVLVARTVGRFDVSPEEIGVGFSYLTVRVALVGLLAGAAVGLLTMGLTRVRERAGQAELDPQDLVRRVQGIVGVVVPTVVGAVLTVLSAGIVPLGLALVGLVLAVLKRLAGDDQPGDGITLGTVFQVLQRLVLLAFAVVVVMTPFLLGDRFADDIVDGKPVAPRILPGIPALTMRRVSVEPLGPAAEAVPDGCVVWLGDAGGVSVLYDADGSTVHRLPDEQISVVSPCDATEQ